MTPPYIRTIATYKVVQTGSVLGQLWELVQVEISLSPMGARLELGRAVELEMKTNSSKFDEDSLDSDIEEDIFTDDYAITVVAAEDADN